MDVKIIGFDWDGTLVDSMIEVKSEAFADAVISYHETLRSHKEEIEDIYLKTRGTPRDVQLRTVEEKYSVEKLSEEEVKSWSDEFTENYIDITPPLFEDTIQTLEELRKKGLEIYLSSSVPQEDLDATLKRYDDIDREMFDYILSTRENAPEGYSMDEMPHDEKRFRKGPGHVYFICQEEDLKPEEIAFVGDAVEDIKGAEKADVVSVGLVDERMPGEFEDEMRSKGADFIIRDRKSLLDLEII